jgi:hypothetical protein
MECALPTLRGLAFLVDYAHCLQIHLILVSPESVIQNCSFCLNILTLSICIESERLSLGKTVLQYRVALESSAHLDTSEPSTMQIACRFRGKLIAGAMNEFAPEGEDFPAHIDCARAVERNEVGSMMDRSANSKGWSSRFLARNYLGRRGEGSYPSLSLRA